MSDSNQDATAPKFTGARDANGAPIPAPPDLGELARQIGAKLAGAAPAHRENRPARVEPHGATAGDLSSLNAALNRELARQRGGRR